MIVSTLGRKVFDQVKLQETIINAWWIEKKLQLMQINGLVKMINNSKKDDLDYIDGYLPNFKWSFRKKPINIDNYEELFYLMQLLDEDFPWGHWSEIIEIDDFKLFHECLSIASMNRKGNLPYSLAIYKSKKREIINSNQYLNNSYINSAEKVKTPDNSLDNSIKLKWDEIKNRI